MKRIILLPLFLLIVYSGCAGESEPQLTDQTKNEIREDAKEFMETLREVLVKEMQTNGLTAAASVCSDTAQILTTNYAAENAMYIKRVSFKNRNAANYPDDFESKGLKHFEDLRNNGTLDETTELFEIVTEGEDKSIRYMKPIFIQAPCLSCHGPEENINQEVKAILISNYPEDKAVGYQAGDLRGAVSVKKVL